MNTTKLPSGRWNSKVYLGKVDGKAVIVSVTAETKKECLAKAAEVKANASPSGKMTVGEAVERYIDVKAGVLSPATVSGYKALQKRYIQGKKIEVCRLDLLDYPKLQAWVSELSRSVSKKTTLNAYGLLSAAVRMYNPRADLSVRFPQGKRYEGYVPSTEEVVRVLQAAKEYDERLYRACLLSAFGTLRRGEISPLTAEDIRDGVLHVEKDMVRDSSGKWVTKLPKTESSVRDVPLPQWIIDEMPKKGPLVDYYPDEITKWFGIVVRRTGLPHFRFHDLRKHSVSLMASRGVSMASIKDLGGWSNLQTPQRIYVKALADAHKREMENYLDFLGDLRVSFV